MKLLVKNRLIIGKKVKLLRKEGLIPCVVYGRHLDESLNVVANKNDLLKIYNNVGASQPFDIEFEDGRKEMVLFHDYQVDPVTDELLHVDLLVLTKGETTNAEITIDYIGESDVEKKKLGRVQIVKNTVLVEALPKDLPKKLEIDLGQIKTTNDVIFVKDLNCPKGVKILDEGDISLVTVSSLGGSDEEDVEESSSGVEDVEQSSDKK